MKVDVPFSSSETAEGARRRGGTTQRGRGDWRSGAAKRQPEPAARCWGRTLALPQRLDRRPVAQRDLPALHDERQPRVDVVHRRGLLLGHHRGGSVPPELLVKAEEDCLAMAQRNPGAIDLIEQGLKGSDRKTSQKPTKTTAARPALAEAARRHLCPSPHRPHRPQPKRPQNGS